MHMMGVRAYLVYLLDRLLGHARRQDGALRRHVVGALLLLLHGRRGLNSSHGTLEPFDHCAMLSRTEAKARPVQWEHVTSLSTKPASIAAGGKHASRVARGGKMQAGVVWRDAGGGEVRWDEVRGVFWPSSRALAEGALIVKTVRRRELKG